MNACAGTLNSALILFLIDGNLWELVLRLQYGMKILTQISLFYSVVATVIISICSYSSILVYYSITM